MTLATVTGIGDVLRDRGVGLRSSTVSSERWNRSAGPLRFSGSGWATSAVAVAAAHSDAALMLVLLDASVESSSVITSGSAV